MPRRIVSVLALVLFGCSSNAPAPAAGQAQPGMSAAQPQPGTTPTSTPTAPPEPARPPAALANNDAPEGTCNKASLAIDKDAAVASVDGVDIKASDLGPDYESAETKALATYCNELSRLRRAAVDRAVEDKLLGAAGQAEGKDADAYLRAYVEQNAKQPTEEELRAFYTANVREGAPEFETVRPQVERAMMEERSQKMYAELIGSLKTKAKVQTMLPDVRPPALDIDIPAGTATFGPASATVEVVEFSDFECPYCARAADAVTEVKKRYGDRVRFAFRHFPLSFHANARVASQVAFCANEQDKFWAVHDEIFAKQRELSADTVRQAAIGAGVDATELDACMSSGRADTAIEADMEKGRQVGVEGTPTFYINGRPFEGQLTAAGLGAAIDVELAS